MTVTWVMIIGGAEELFVSAAAKAKTRDAHKRR